MTVPQPQFSTDPNSIVNVVVRTIQAPTPNNYQQQGALISQGATSLTAPDAALLTQYSDLGALIQPAVKVTSAVWAAGHVTVTMAAPMTRLVAAEQLQMVMRDFTSPTADLSAVYLATVIDQISFTIPMTTDPGTPLKGGTAQPAGSVELDQMARTYFAQGPGAAVYVLELGTSTDATDGIGNLKDWLDANPFSFYGYLLPRAWAADTTATNALLTEILAMYENPEAMTYFWATVKASTTALIPPEAKCAIKFIEAAAVNASLGYEFSAAAMFFNAISYKPTAVTPMAPMAFKYLYGVTPMETKNNGPALKGFKASFTNYVATGAEGGINFYMVYQGVTADGNDYFNWWYTIDWVQISVNLDVSNAVINGSNNPLAPLYYDQDGINVLLSVLAGTMTRGVQLGMVLGRVVQTELDPGSLNRAIYAGTFAGQCDCNAVPFLLYSQMNPSDYKEGEYDGLSTIFIPRRGFIHILITIVASQIVTL